MRWGRAPFALAFALALFVASAAAVALWQWESWLDHGTTGTERNAGPFLDPKRSPAPLVLAIGDSTFRLRQSLPRHVADRLGGAVELRIFWNVGMSPAEAALLAAAGLELEPAAVILLAHFATFEAPRPLRYPELAGLVPPHRLPALAGLPFSKRGLGLGELVLRSLSGALIAPDWLRVSRGGAAWLQDVLDERWAVNPGSDMHRLGRMSELRHEAILRSIQNGYPGHASVEMLHGTVKMIEEAGSQAIVVISPIHVEPLRGEADFDERELARRVSHVGARVEAAGGEVIDVHDALAPNEFRDELGHYTKRGAYRISLPLEAALRRTLGLPPGRAGR